MTAAASHPELYDALREAGASEGRARAAERATLSADQAATKSEVREKVSEEIRPVDRRLTQLLTTATIIGGLIIATFFFVVSAWLNAKHAADSISDIRANISANARAIAENKAAIESNAAAIAAKRHCRHRRKSGGNPSQFREIGPTRPESAGNYPPASRREDGITNFRFFRFLLLPPLFRHNCENRLLPIPSEPKPRRRNQTDD